jgi:hypothetical protein
MSNRKIKSANKLNNLHKRKVLASRLAESGQLDIHDVQRFLGCLPIASTLKYKISPS